jgi:hypothetical protein
MEVAEVLEDLPSDISSSSRRLMPISWEGAFRLSVGVENSGDGDDVSNPDRSSSATLPPGGDKYYSERKTLAHACNHIL